MPYGSQGDNPITDIIIHNLPGFGEPYDALIRKIGKHARYKVVRIDLDKICTDYMHSRSVSDTAGDAFKQGLEGLLVSLDS
ncbi:MAG: hypothetical protein HEP71_10135 [Roseivirga sp.]|nr:hypothetical protein [Roseivirga sp.]